MTKIYISYPKINVFFKIIGLLPNGYCSIASRYIKVQNVFFDTLEIGSSSHFRIEGDFKCKLESNTIFMAKLALQEYLDSNKAKYLESFCIKVDKKIPIFAGLGGGSSNAGIYLLAMNELLELGLDKNALGFIAQRVGADVSFFVYDYASANVSGFGEVVEEFIEEGLDFEILTPPINAHTNEVFAEFKREYGLESPPLESHLVKSCDKKYGVSKPPHGAESHFTKTYLPEPRLESRHKSRIQPHLESKSSPMQSQHLESSQEPHPLESIPAKSKSPIVPSHRLESSLNLAKEMMRLDSLELLRRFPIEVLNDLYLPATRLYGELLVYAKDGYFFSGSGSSFFRLK